MNARKSIKGIVRVKPKFLVRKPSKEGISFTQIIHPPTVELFERKVLVDPVTSTLYMEQVLTIWILSTINGVLSVGGTTGNLLVFFVIYRNEELQTGVNFFILSLSVADLTVCSIAQPLYIYYLNQEWNTRDFETFKLVSYIALHFSFFNLLLLTINRLFAIWFSFEYGTVMRGKNIALIVCIAWIFSAVMAVAFISSPLKETAPYFHLTMLLMFLIMYLRIFCIARKQRRQIVSQFESIAHNYRVTKVRGDHLTTRTLAILISVSVVLFLPDLVFQLIGSTDFTRFRSSFTTMFLSSFLNPCVYVWRCEKFRLALYKTLGLSRLGRRSKIVKQVDRTENSKGGPLNESGNIVTGRVRVINVKALSECTENCENLEGKLPVVLIQQNVKMYQKVESGTDNH